GSDLNAVSVSITKNGVEIYNSASASGSFDFNSSGLGTYVMSVSATDADGDWIGDSLSNAASRTVTVSDDDTTPPLIVLSGSIGTESQSATQSFTWGITDTSGLSLVNVSITKNGSVIFTSAASSGSYNFDALGLGTYVISVSAT